MQEKDFPRHDRYSENKNAARQKGVWQAILVPNQAKLGKFGRKIDTMREIVFYKTPIFKVVKSTKGVKRQKFVNTDKRANTPILQKIHRLIKGIQHRFAWLKRASDNSFPTKRENEKHRANPENEEPTRQKNAKASVRSNKDEERNYND